MGHTQSIGRLPAAPQVLCQAPLLHFLLFLSPEQLQLDQGRCGEEAAQIQELQRQLREQEEVVRELQEQLAGSTASVKEAKAQVWGFPPPSIRRNLLAQARGPSSPAS